MPVIRSSLSNGDRTTHPSSSGLILQTVVANGSPHPTSFEQCGSFMRHSRGSPQKPRSSRANSDAFCCLKAARISIFSNSRASTLFKHAHPLNSVVPFRHKWISQSNVSWWFSVSRVDDRIRSTCHPKGTYGVEKVVELNS